MAKTITLRVIAYKSKVDGHLLDNIIGTSTKIKSILTGKWGELKFNYSHMELWEPNEAREFVHIDDSGNPHYLGTCYTSTTRGEAKGVVKRPASEVLTHPDRWDYWEIEVDAGCWEPVKEWFREEIGKGYDKAGAIGCVFWNNEDPNIWFSSEIVMALLDYLGVLELVKWAISPRAAAAKITKKFGEPIQLSGRDESKF